jgi:hypothetical protein
MAATRAVGDFGHSQNMAHSSQVSQGKSPCQRVVLLLAYTALGRRRVSCGVLEDGEAGWLVRTRAMS